MNQDYQILKQDLRMLGLKRGGYESVCRTTAANAEGLLRTGTIQTIQQFF